MAEKSQRMKRIARSVLSWLCAFLAFALVCAAVGRFFPQKVSGVSLKEERFREQRKRIDILFVGSSRVFHGISPKVFDRTLHAAGRPWHSFNAGVDAMNPAEEFALVRRLLALHPPRLKYIFFEFQSDPGAGTPIRDDLVRERDVYWRDWDSVRAGFQKFALGVSSPLASSLGDNFSLGRLMYFGPLLSADLRLWVRNVTHFGGGFSIVQRIFGGLPANSNELNMPHQWDGFFPMGQPMTGKILSEYRKSLQDLRDHPVKRLPDPIMRSQLSRFAHLMAARNIQVVFLLPPSVVGNPGDEINAPPGSLLMAYDNLERYPQFYAEENRVDRWHLNARGADLFSRQLASDFVRALDSPDR
jgi:hypothetical protein